jgi:hypothetical protein
MAIIYGLKVNLSVALVAMLNHTAIKESGDHSHGLNFTAPPPQCAPPAVNGSIAIKPQVIFKNPMKRLFLAVANKTK